jgi:hypothetical protein
MVVPPQHPGTQAPDALAFLLAGPVYDLVTRRRVHPAYLWGGLLAMAAIPPVVAQLSATAAW